MEPATGTASGRSPAERMNTLATEMAAERMRLLSVIEMTARSAREAMVAGVSFMRDAQRQSKVVLPNASSPAAKMAMRAGAIDAKAAQQMLNQTGPDPQQQLIAAGKQAMEACMGMITELFQYSADFQSFEEQASKMVAEIQGKAPPKPRLVTE